MTIENAKTILAAVDTSGTSRSVFKESLVLASSMRAQVVLVAVTPQYEGNTNRFFIKDSRSQFSEPFRKVLKDHADYAASLGLQLRTILRTGKPRDEILAVAAEEKASLIVLGCQKRSQVERMMLGRTTAEIIASGLCDVLLVPEESEIRFNKILVGINGHPASVEAGERAFDVAGSYGSEVHGLHVIDIPTDRSLRYGVLKDAEQKGRKLLREYAMQGENRDIPVITDMRWDTPEKGLVEYATEKSIQLIVLGSKMDSGLLDMFRESVVEGVASLASCPVLVTRQRPSEEQN